MSELDFLREGKPEAALAALQDQVRKDPASVKHRVFLFQLLAVLGRWDRALNQLEVAGELDPAALPMTQTYREAIRCEVLRKGVFAGERSPLFFGEPEEWMALLIEALRVDATGNAAAAADLRARAFDVIPPTAGSVDGAPFAWIADADPRLGPVLEAVVNGHYYWIPFHRIRKIDLEAPVDLRDVVWTPAHFEWANGGEAVGLIPTRYPGSEASEDGLIQLARRTDWLEGDADSCCGLGQRMLATDAGEYSLMDLRLVALEPAPAAADEAKEVGSEDG